MGAQKDITIRMLLIGAGHAGHLLLRLFQAHAGVHIVAVVDVNPAAPGLCLARTSGITTGADYHSFLEEEGLDLIVNVTGSEELQQRLAREKPPRTELLGGSSAMLIWMLLREYEEKEALEDRFQLVQRELEQRKSGEFIVGSHPQMQELEDMIAHVSPTSTSVLLLGETGTGKEVVARMIHKHSAWHDHPLVSVNCTAFSPGLIESELFGYVKGAFTGATEDKIGLIERADGGTIFLDEIGDMPLEMQAKLLRFLQEGEIRPVGSHVTKRVRVRVIAATNRDLEKAIDQRAFRADLFYRLNAFTLRVPPLRQRRADIPLLAYHFLKRAQAKINKRVTRISLRALSALQAYDWPGNLRELSNVIERAAVLTDTGEIDVHHLPLSLRPETAWRVLDTTRLKEGLAANKEELIARFEREAVYRYLAEYGGNISRAARAAKVSRRTLHRLINKYNISTDVFEPSEA